MRPVCLICEMPVKPRRNSPFAPCKRCKKWQQVLYIETAKAESIFYDSYMINLYVDAKMGLCSLLTSDGNCKFPLGKRYDVYALEQMLYASSAEFNTDYVCEDYLKNLVKSAIEGIHYQMRIYGIRRVKRVKSKPEKVLEIA